MKTNSKDLRKEQQVVELRLLESLERRQLNQLDSNNKLSRKRLEVKQLLFRKREEVMQEVDSLRMISNS